MSKILKSQSGIVPVFEAILLVLVLAVLGFAGYRVYAEKYTAPKPADQKVAKKATPTPTPQATPNPYTGWKSYTLKYEKMTFKYPSDLTVQDTSMATTAADNVTPGMDRVRLVGSGGFVLSIQTGLDGIGGGCPECTIDYHEPIVIVGNQLKLNYVNSGNGLISSIAVAKLDNDFIGGFDSKNINIVGSTNRPATLVSMSFKDANDTAVGKPLATYKTEHFVTEGKLVLQSASY